MVKSDLRPSYNNAHLGAELENGITSGRQVETRFFTWECSRVKRKSKMFAEKKEKQAALNGTHCMCVCVSVCVGLPCVNDFEMISKRVSHFAFWGF